MAAICSKIAAIGVAVAISFVPVLRAEDSSLQIHGFGGWFYARTNHGNTYLGGLPEGNYRSSDLAINLEDKVSDQLRVVLQAFWSEDENGNTSRVDFAFAEWRVSDKLRFRGGQVKLPFGLSSEIFDVGTLRPFLRLPQSIYGRAGFAGESYQGIGITGTLGGRSGWSYGYDLYAGGLHVENFERPLEFLEGQPAASSDDFEEETVRNMVGGRFMLHSPLEHLELGASAYTGTLNEAGSPRHSVGAASVSYLDDRWSIRTEYAYRVTAGDVKGRGFYVEPAFRITDHWQVAGQYDQLTASIFDVRHPSEPSFLMHREAAVGLNYWLSPQLVVKASFHHVRGNRFAAPARETFDAVVAAGQLQHTTSLFMFGVNFAF